MEDKSIETQEDELFAQLKGTYDCPEQLVQDGLCVIGELEGISRDGRTYYNVRPRSAAERMGEEQKWREQARRVVFLLKDPNGNPGEDYRCWGWRAFASVFSRTLYYQLEGLMTVSEGVLPCYDDLNWPEVSGERYSLAMVNVKKVSGGSSVSWGEVYQAAERDQTFLRRQVREILNPNIVVCCGSGGMLDIAMRFIYPDIKEGFKQVNSWCYYDKERDLLLIDAYHPSYRVSYERKVGRMLEAVQQFIREEQPKMFTAGTEFAF